MKKSEIIKIIEDTVYETYDYDPDLGWTIDAEEVLKRIEEAGMIPPLTFSNKIIMKEGVLTAKLLDNLRYELEGKIGNYNWEWEDEDET